MVLAISAAGRLSRAAVFKKDILAVINCSANLLLAPARLKWYSTASAYEGWCPVRCGVVGLVVEGTLLCWYSLIMFSCFDDRVNVQ